MWNVATFIPARFRESQESGNEGCEEECTSIRSEGFQPETDLSRLEAIELRQNGAERKIHCVFGNQDAKGHPIRMELLIREYFEIT